MQIRDGWLLFDPKLGKQHVKKVGSGLMCSLAEFEETGFLEVAPNEITTDIA